MKRWMDKARVSHTNAPSVRPYTDMLYQVLILMNSTGKSDKNDEYDIPLAKPEHLWNRSHKPITVKATMAQISNDDEYIEPGPKVS